MTPIHTQLEKIVMKQAVSRIAKNIKLIIEDCGQDDNVVEEIQDFLQCSFYWTNNYWESHSVVVEDDGTIRIGLQIRDTIRYILIEGIFERVNWIKDGF